MSGSMSDTVDTEKNETQFPVLKEDNETIYQMDKYYVVQQILQ